MRLARTLGVAFSYFVHFALLTDTHTRRLRHRGRVYGVFSSQRLSNSAPTSVRCSPISKNTKKSRWEFDFLTFEFLVNMFEIADFILS